MSDQDIGSEIIDAVELQGISVYPHPDGRIILVLVGDDGPHAFHASREKLSQAVYLQLVALDRAV